MFGVPTRCLCWFILFQQQVHMKNEHVYIINSYISILTNSKLMCFLTRNKNMCSLLQSITFWLMGGHMIDYKGFQALFQMLKVKS